MTRYDTWLATPPDDRWECPKCHERITEDEEFCADCAERILADKQRECAEEKDDENVESR